MPRNNMNPQDKLTQTRLKIEQARLAKLEAELPKPAPNYTRYEDIPPPSPEERARFRERLEALIEKIETQAEKDKRAWYLSMTDHAP